jgi:hypothetical protein
MMAALYPQSLPVHWPARPVNTRESGWGARWRARRGARRGARRIAAKQVAICPLAV